MESSETRDQTHVSCIGRHILYSEPPRKPQVTQLFWFCWQNSSKWLRNPATPNMRMYFSLFLKIFLCKLLSAAVVPNVRSLDRPSTSDYLEACEKCKFTNSPQASRNSWRWTADCVSSKSSRWFWCRLEFETHNYRMLTGGSSTSVAIESHHCELCQIWSFPAICSNRGVGSRFYLSGLFYS